MVNKSQYVEILYYNCAFYIPHDTFFPVLMYAFLYK